MDAARQVIRWSIPGSLLLVSASITLIALAVALGRSPEEAVSVIRDNLSPAAGIALSIPLGFCVYQGYYWGYGPIRWFGFVSANRGLAVLEYLTPSQRAQLAPLVRAQISHPTRAIPTVGLEGLDRWVLRRLSDPYWVPPAVNNGRPLLRRTRWLELQQVWHEQAVWATPEQKTTIRLIYRRRWWVHHQIAATLLDIAALGPGDAIKREWIAVADVYHSIGATRTAIMSGLALGSAPIVVDAALRGDERTQHLERGGFVLVCLIVVCGALVQLLNRVRRHTYFSATERAGLGLRVVLARDPQILEGLVGPRMSTKSFQGNTRARP